MIDLQQFQNKKLLITGSSTGLGAACASYFNELGAEILICGKNSRCCSNILLISA